MTTDQERLIDQHVGGSLRMRRISLGISQIQLGRCLGVTFQQIQKYELGKNRLSASALYLAAAELGVKPGYFYEGLELDDDGWAISQSVVQAYYVNSPQFGFHEFVALNTAFRCIRSAAIRGAILDLVKCLGTAQLH